MPLDSAVIAYLDAGPYSRADVHAVTQAFTDLRVAVSPEVIEFYQRYEGPFGTRYSGFELLDLCVGSGETTVTGATIVCRESFALPEHLLVISSYLGNGVLILDTDTDQVFSVDFEGGLEELIAGRLQSIGTFTGFLSSYFLGSKNT